MNHSVKFLTIFYVFFILSLFSFPSVSPAAHKLKHLGKITLKIQKIFIFFLEKRKDSKPPIVSFFEKTQNNNTNNNLGNETGLLEDHMNETNAVNDTKILPDAKISTKKTQKSANGTFSNITDISFAKNYLTFTQLSKGLLGLKNASAILFQNISKQIGQKEYNYGFIALGLCFLVSLIFVFFKRKLFFSIFFKNSPPKFSQDVKDNSKLPEIITEKLFSKMNAKNSENKIILRGRTIRRPANQYHYLLEKNSNDDISEVSNESEDNMFFFNVISLSKI